MKRYIPYIIISSVLVLMSACGPKVPENYATSNEHPRIYPDYIGVTVPVNMAPLTF